MWLHHQDMQVTNVTFVCQVYSYEALMVLFHHGEYLIQWNFKKWKTWFWIETLPFSWTTITNAEDPDVKFKFLAWQHDLWGTAELFSPVYYIHLFLPLYKLGSSVCSTPEYFPPVSPMMFVLWLSGCSGLHDLGFNEKTLMISRVHRQYQRMPLPAFPVTGRIWSTELGNELSAETENIVTRHAGNQPWY